MPLDTTMSQMSPVHILLNQLLGTESLFSSQFSSASQEITRVFLWLGTHSPMPGVSSTHSQILCV